MGGSAVACWWPGPQRSAASAAHFRKGGDSTGEQTPLGGESCAPTNSVGPVCGKDLGWRLFLWVPDGEDSSAWALLLRKEEPEACGVAANVRVDRPAGAGPRTGRC